MRQPCQPYFLVLLFYPVVVVGHSECGGASTCLNAAQNPSFAADGSITTIPSLSPDAPLNRWLGPLTKHVKSLELSGMPKEEALPIVVQENVKWQVERVCKTQPIINAWSKKEKVWVHGCVYDLASGRLRDLGISKGLTEST
jgi:carbonic anhydrase